MAIHKVEQRTQINETNVPDGYADVGVDIQDDSFSDASQSDRCECQIRWIDKDDTLIEWPDEQGTPTSQYYSYPVIKGAQQEMIDQCLEQAVWTQKEKDRLVAEEGEGGGSLSPS